MAVVSTVLRLVTLSSGAKVGNDLKPAANFGDVSWVWPGIESYSASSHRRPFRMADASGTDSRTQTYR